MHCVRTAYVGISLYKHNMNPESNVEKLDQKVRIVNGAENILNFYISRVNLLKKSVACCYDYYGPIRIRQTPLIWKNNLEADKRGIMVRFLTEIRTENVEYCKKMIEEIKHIEMRHLDGVKGNFVIHDDREYFLPHFVDKPEEPVKEALICEQKEMVEAHLFIFENLWSKATPAKLKIKEIEEGIKPDFSETIDKPSELKRIIVNLLQNAVHDISILFSSANSFQRLEREEILNLIISAAQRDVNIRLVVQDMDDIVRQEITLKLNERNSGNKIDIRYIDRPLPTKNITIIVDSRYSLLIETKNDTAARFTDSIGLATYSNTESAALTHTAIFETYWILRGIKN